MNAIMLSCVKATELMELREEAPFGFIKNMQLKMQVAFCLGCKNYMKQTKTINEILHKNNLSPAVVTQDTTALEASIINKL